MIALQLAWRNLVRNRERSLLTLIGVLLAIGSFVALVSLAEGLAHRVRQELDDREVDLYILPQKSMALPTGPIGTLGLSGETIAKERVDQVQQVQNVAKVVGVNRDTWTGNRTVIPVLFIDGNSLPAFFTRLQGAPGVLSGNQIFIGEGLKQLEFPTGVPQSIMHGQTEYGITGIVRGGGFQNYMAYAHLTPEMAANGHHELWVQLVDHHDAVGTAQRIRDLQIPNVIVLTKRQYLARSHEYLDYARLLQICIAAVGVLISITASMNTMLMSTYERFREFATLRAIGASRVTVATMVCAESILLSLFGGALGIVFGVLVAGVLDRAVVVLLRLPFPLGKITPLLMLEAVGVSILVGLIGAFIPAILVWRLNLMEGLRRD